MTQEPRNMRALSIRQPWADLILTGQKDVEIRVWRAIPPVKFPERIWVHSGKTLEIETYYALKGMFGEKIELKRNPYDYERGGLLGQVDIVDVIQYGSAMQFDSDKPRHLNVGWPVEMEEFRIIPGQNRVIGLVMKNPKKLKNPIKYTGKLGFFEVALAK